jgi:hypothetical protein
MAIGALEINVACHHSGRGKAKQICRYDGAHRRTRMPKRIKSLKEILAMAASHDNVYCRGFGQL